VGGNHRPHQGGLPRFCDVSLVLCQICSKGGVNQIALAKRWPVQAFRFVQDDFMRFGPALSPLSGA
jgi:hypothetical protein